MSARSTRLVAALAWCAALYPLGRWWWRRLSEPMDAGALAAVSLLVFVIGLWRTSADRRAPLPAWKLWLAASGLLLFAAVQPVLPVTLAAMPAFLAGLPLLLPENMRQGRCPLPLFALAALAFPSLLVLDLFLGVPLRSCAVAGAVVLLKGLGFEVVQRGFELTVEGRTIWVDAPCAGVKMLAAGGWLACVLAQLSSLRVRRTLALGVLTLFVLVACNCARVTALALAEVNGFNLSSTAHSAVGLLSLLPGVVACAVAAIWLGSGQTAATRTPEGAPGRLLLPLLSLFGAASLCLASGSLIRPVAADVADFPGWPRVFEGVPLEPEPLAEFERDFADAFPGAIGRFRAGESVVILRWTDRVTHRAHSASICLQAAGWRQTSLPMVRRADGDWSAFSATRGEVELHVREQVRADAGRTFSDIPSWFVSAGLGRARGPWWIVTVITRPNAAVTPGSNVGSADREL